MKFTVKQRIIASIKDVLPKALKTSIWLLKITIGISIGILILRYLNILPWFSEKISPIFNLVGLPGEAALAFVSGYFVNCYSAIAVIATLDLDTRAVTILGTMVLCAHNMITETAVQKKTGSSGIRMVIIRTFSAFFLGYILNIILPGGMVSSLQNSASIDQDLPTMIEEWARSTFSIVIKMTFLIFALSIMQRILAEFGVIRWLSKGMRPIMAIFGLPAKTSFLWIVANILGLAYGAAIMIDEAERGKVSKKEINLLNNHIAISHSNFEDLFLLSSVGGIWYIILFSRWIMSMILVWELRIENLFKERFSKKKCNFVGSN